MSPDTFTCCRCKIDHPRGELGYEKPDPEDPRHVHRFCKATVAAMREATRPREVGPGHRAYLIQGLMEVLYGGSNAGN